MFNKNRNTGLTILILGLATLLVGGCGPTGDTDGLKQNVDKSKYNITSLLIRPKYTTTLSPLATPPANPKYYFDHNDTEQLEAVGITAGGDEVVLQDAVWDLTDNTATAGATTISQDGLLSLEKLPVSQSKDITVKASFAALSTSADIVISSYPLSTNGLSIKIDDSVVNSTSQSMVVCGTKTLTVEGLFDDGSTRDITNKIDWSSANTDSNGKFDLSNPNQAVFSAHTNATYTISPTYKKQGSASVDLVVTQSGFGNLQLSPDTLTLNLGDSQTMTATADIDTGNGNVNTDVSQRAKWESADTTIFTVASDGTVKGVATGGPLNLTATCGSASMTASVTVMQGNAIKSIEILDTDFSQIDLKSLVVNGSVNLKLRLYRFDGSTEDITSDADTNWEILDIPNQTEPITVNNTDNKGLVTATAVGIGQVVAKYRTYKTDLLINVTAN